jgi:hypothetical protein
LISSIPSFSCKSLFSLSLFSSCNYCLFFRLLFLSELLSSPSTPCLIETKFYFRVWIPAPLCFPAILYLHRDPLSF